MTILSRERRALELLFDEIGEVAVAVSGGVDSLTLAAVAHERLGEKATMFHAVSPAVPGAATRRVSELAERFGWALVIVDAQEFDDEDYMSNPVDRCFYCKRDLYGTITRSTDATVVSGTNTDDLGDYRPGLRAASDAAVRHPFVEAGIDKDAVRLLAAQVGLGAVADLPAAPCLSSRMETGIAIQPEWLAVIDETETALRAQLRPETVRCRVRADRISVEIDKPTLAGLDVGTRAQLVAEVERRWRAVGVDQRVTLDPYRMGSAFLRVTS